MQKVGKDDEEELLDSSTAAAALAPESNVEHIKQVKEKLDTGVLDGTADESDRILWRKGNGKKKFKKNGNGNSARTNPWVKNGSSSSKDTSIDLASARKKIDELTSNLNDLAAKLNECEATKSPTSAPTGNPTRAKSTKAPFVDSGGYGAAESPQCNPTADYGNGNYQTCRYGDCNVNNGNSDCFGAGKKV